MSDLTKYLFETNAFKMVYFTEKLDLTLLMVIFYMETKKMLNLY